MTQIILGSMITLYFRHVTTCSIFVRNLFSQNQLIMFPSEKPSSNNQFHKKSLV